MVWAEPICGECARVLPVMGALNRVCIQCHPQLEYVELLGDALGAENSRELDALAELMKKRDMTARGVIRHLFRLGHLMDKHMSEEPNATMGYLDAQGDFHAFFDSLPKLAPMPVPHDCSEHIQMVNGSPRCQICGAQ